MAVAQSLQLTVSRPQSGRPVDPIRQSAYHPRRHTSPGSGPGMGQTAKSGEPGKGHPMDAAAMPFPAAKYNQVWPGRWRDGRTLLILLLLALLLLGWAVWQTEVPARDSIGFIRYAL